MSAVEAPRSKAELLQRQHLARANWEALLARVPSERIAEPGVKGQLSAKDIVAHLAAWERHAAHASGSSPAARRRSLCRRLG